MSRVKVARIEDFDVGIRKMAEAFKQFGRTADDMVIVVDSLASVDYAEVERRMLAQLALTKSPKTEPPEQDHRHRNRPQQGHPRSWRK